MIEPAANEILEAPESGKGKEWILRLSLQEGSQPANTVILDFSLQMVCFVVAA